jgi:DNA-binding NtrC family response regulator
MIIGRSGPRQVLIVEDEPFMRRTLEALLGDEGLVTFAASSLAGARALLSATAPDLILLDHHLGDGVGTTLLDELPASSKRAVILVSASSNAAIIAERHQVPLLEKPFELRSLLELVERMTTRDLADVG